nr:hypothetical protein [uncultured Roseococcus sp.]
MSNRTLVHEMANAPGTNVTFNLAGPIDGRRSFAMAFPSGAPALYVITDGRQSEWGLGTFTAGSPNTLSRTTVFGNSANTTARLNFTGAVDVYNSVPAELQLFAGAGWGGTAGGTANALSCTVPMPLVAQIPGMGVRLICTATNTGPVTLNVNGIGAMPLRQANAAEIPPGMLQAGSLIEVVASSATAWRLAPEPLAGLTRASPLGGLRNQIINGDFRLNQRGYVSGAAVAAGEYTLDRWRVAGGGYVSYSPSGIGRVVSIPSAVYYEQIVEDLPPGTYALSWEGTAVGIVNNATVVPNGGSFATGGGNTSLTFSGGTLGKVQVEPGTAPTPFELRHVTAELRLAQRYYYRYGRPDTNGRPTLGLGIVVSNALIGIVRHPVRMRAAPAAGFGGSWQRFPQMETATTPIATESNRDFMTWWSAYTANNGEIRRLDGVDANAWYSADAEF